MLFWPDVLPEQHKENAASGPRGFDDTGQVFLVGFMIVV